MMALDGGAVESGVRGGGPTRSYGITGSYPALPTDHVGERIRSKGARAVEARQAGLCSLLFQIAGVQVKRVDVL
jgi:hypothetical protein